MENKINNRISELRKFLKMNQEDFGSGIGLTKTAISYIESGKRGVTESNIKLICTTYNVNEDWIRNGQGGMFTEPSTFSLNEYAKKSNLSELEFDLIKAYMDLDVNARNEILSSMKVIFDKHSEIATTKENYIDKELESYRLELEAEQKGEEKSSVLEGTEEKRKAR